MCPYKPGDVIWYIYGMPGGDWIPRLVISVNGDRYKSFDPFLGRDVENTWHENDPIIQKCGDTWFLKRESVGDTYRNALKKRADLEGIALSFVA